MEDRSPEDLGLAPDLSRLSSEASDLIQHGNRGQYPSSSEAIAAVCAAMFQVGYGFGEVWTVITDPTYGISNGFSRRTGSKLKIG